MKLLLVALFCSACGVGLKEPEGSVRKVSSSLLSRYGSSIAYHADRVAKVTSLAKLDKNAKEVLIRVTKVRKGLETHIAELSDDKSILKVNAEYQQWALDLKQDLAYLNADGGFNLKVKLNKAKDEQAAQRVIKNLQAIDSMLATKLTGVERVLDKETK